MSLTSVTTNDQNQADHSGHSETLMLKDSNLIKTLAEAMNKSNKLLGELDWAPEFRMNLVYGDGYSKDYYIAIGDEPGYKGVFTTAENGGQGYSIPVKNSDQLRKLIFGTADQANIEQTESLESSVKVTGPVTISYNDLSPVTTRAVFLNLQLLDGTKGYSIKLDKVDDHSFKRSYYDNVAGKRIENIFQWDGRS
ncbi:hypothetical protein [Paenibacillus pseudetheri]|uniref:YhfM-like domain-containing protein n=1 Tax=Paenibacillus pseudetheri TaxID=2897682 RepID=A0ABM9BBC7_9BACL|nr:hypothetical protein [Paenibacillus pseudetheri]CAH1056014.1 hypothetical protein PAECIP111894_02167 [Paenibacillus pseudetheri]